jgi:hypothetical protein
VLRTLRFLVAMTVVATFGATARAQDQTSSPDQPQSLGDAARQARKDKEKNAAKPRTVYTEDTLGSGGSGGSLGLGALSQVSPASAVNSKGGSVSGGAASAAAVSGASASGGMDPSSFLSGAGGGDPVSSAYQGIDRAEAALNRLEPMDRATLAKNALEGNGADFPGRRAWEEKLFAAKQTYVSRSRYLLQQMRGLMNNAVSAQTSGAGPDSAQAQDLMGRAQQLLQAAQQTESAFKAVITEGQELAKQAKAQ